ncbi:MAG: prepilin peptidase [Clostridia bacterium]|nr:prepilin peptidase [Clostridia bacterium]
MIEKIWVSGSLLLLVFCLIPICREDLRSRTIPQKWCIALGAGGLVLALARTLADVISVYRGTGSPIAGAAVYTPILLSAAGALAASGLGLLCRGAVRDGFGWGDVKLMAALGAAMGLFPFLRGMALTGLVSLAAALFLLVTKKAKTSDTLPFAPFLAAGALVSEVLEWIMETG